MLFLKLLLFLKDFSESVLISLSKLEAVIFYLCASKGPRVRMVRKGKMHVFYYIALSFISRVYTAKLSRHLHECWECRKKSVIPV